MAAKPNEDACGLTRSRSDMKYGRMKNGEWKIEGVCILYYTFLWFG